MRMIFCALLLVSLIACGKAPEIPASIARVTPVSDQERSVRAFVEAFSNHDADAMAALCIDNLQWGYVSGVDFSIAGNGLEDLRTQMANYFESRPGVHSKIESLIAHNDTIAISERVFWTPADGEREKNQASIAVYQFKDGKIAAVWYYPAQ